MLSPWLSARKYKGLALRALRGATSAKQTAWLKMGRERTVGFCAGIDNSCRLGRLERLAVPATFVYVCGFKSRS